MSIVIFIIILSVLIVVHELGHFLAAKKFGIRVDEFGLGYPPKAKKLFRWKGTDFTLNWLPFGGFVKIFGENPAEAQEKLPLSNSSNVSFGKHGQNSLDEVSPVPESAPTSEEVGVPTENVGNNFQNKNRGIQATVLGAGVFCNFLFAWLLISIGLMAGMSAPVGTSLPVENPRTVITTVLPGSPAAEAGIRSGDAITSVSRGEEMSGITPGEISSFIASSEAPLTFQLERGDESYAKVVEPREGIISDKPAIGVSMDTVGIVKLGPLSAVWNGLKVTTELTWLTTQALGAFVAQAVVGQADLSQITGPVGIVAMVGDVSELGFSFLLSFTALISINLAIINLVPFPALDGGRLLFVGIEALRRKPVPPVVFNVVNTIGFALLIILMVVITVRDVRNIF